MLFNTRDILSVAQAHHFAVPAFNIGTGAFLNAVLECCEEVRSPLILQGFPAEMEFQGEHFVAGCLAAAHRASIPVAVHLDHGLKFSQILWAI